MTPLTFCHYFAIIFLAKWKKLKGEQPIRYPTAIIRAKKKAQVVPIPPKR